MRRVACIALPQIRVEIAREKPGDAPKDDAPMAVVIARPGGAVRSERDVLGNTRLDVVSKEARACGVRASQTVAAARAKCAALCVRVVAENAVRLGLSRVAEVALAFGPSTAFDVATDVVWVEIGGCAHLHGGERELARVLEGRVRALGHVCRVSIADGPRIAAAVARWCSSRAAAQGPLVVPPGNGSEAMRVLPIEALDLEDGDGSVVVWLKDLGLRTCGDLQKLPRRSLGTRLGAHAKDVMQLLSGEDCAPLDAWRPPEVPEERAELEWGASSVESLAFVAKALCDRLAARLEGRAVGAARVGLGLALDRALLAEGASPSLAIEVALPVPIVRASDLFAVVRTRLERVDLPAPVLAVTLRALELSSARPRALDLLAPEPKADRALPPLVAELTADLGATSVGTLALADKWSPDERTRLIPFGVAKSHSHPAAGSVDVPSALTMSAIEPSRLVHSSRPVSKSIDSFEGVSLLSRLEAVEWWRQHVPRRDFYAAWDGAGLAWVEVRSTTERSCENGEKPIESADSRKQVRRLERRESAGSWRQECWVRGWID
jgi:protein ImuB